MAGSLEKEVEGSRSQTKVLLVMTLLRKPPDHHLGPIIRQHFFTPIPCTYISSPLDGMAKNYFIFYRDTQDHAIYHVWIHFIPTTLYPRREKTIRSELELNPGPLASQATTLTTRPGYPTTYQAFK